MPDPTFALIGHPVNVDQIERSMQNTRSDYKIKNKDFIGAIFSKIKPFIPEELEINSCVGLKRKGIFITCTFISEIENLSKMEIFQKITDSCILADNSRAKIAGLGGHTSIAVQFYENLIISQLKNLKITSGNTLTSASLIEQIKKIVAEGELNLKELHIAVLGGTGDIGGSALYEFAEKVQNVVITARDIERMKNFAEKVKKEKGVEIEISTDNKKAVQNADIVIAATSASTAILESKDFRRGAIVCDVGYPKNINLITGQRDDIIVFAGGMVRLQNPIKFKYDILNYRDDLLYGCFAEAIILDFENRYENYSIGRGNITRERMDEILSLALKHGFSPYHLFDLSRKKYLSSEEIKEFCNSFKQ